MLHYYQHHIGDFVRDTARLSDSQCMAYLRLIWRYYDTELPFEDDVDSLAFLIGANQQEVLLILKHYFILKDGFWHHTRCDEEIIAYKEKAEKAKKSANARWNNASGMRTHNERNANEQKNDANQEPITNNKPKEKVDKKKPATRIPQDWEPSETDIQFCRTERPDLDPYKTGERFKDYWLGISGAKGCKLDWPATWRNWVRNEKKQFVVNGESQKDRERREWQEKMFGKKGQQNDCIDSTAQRLD